VRFLNFLAHERFLQVAPIVAFATLGVSIWAIIFHTVIYPADDVAARKICDQAVAALLHSKDPVELQRADIIIRELSCGVSRRLESIPELPRP
jgi:hypothetical protein